MNRETRVCDSIFEMLPDEHNPSPVETHFRTTGLEICRQTEGRITHLFVSRGRAQSGRGHWQDDCPARHERNRSARRRLPGAKSIPWSAAVGPDGTFKPAAELRSIYLNQKGVDAKKDTFAYCRIGEPSSHTWFVLKYLLGLNEVRNYDGSWTKYGNVVGTPIEKA